ncbi:MAG TPA: OsmC family protein [Micromonosporaceae bacterium]
MAETTWVHAADATAAGGRVRTDDGALFATLASPLAPDGSGLTPEQLLAAAFATCLHHAAVEAATAVTDESHTVQVRAETRLGRDENGRYRADVRACICSAGLSRDQVARLVEYAERLWPFAVGDGRYTISVAAESAAAPNPRTAVPARSDRSG